MTFGFSLQIHTSKDETVLYCSWFFTANRLIGMFDAADPNKFARVSRFLGGISDVICGNKDSADITRV